MDSLKVKNFIILVLLIVNAVLLAVVISDRLRGDELWDQSVQGAVAQLEENGIAVSEDADLSTRSTTSAASRAAGSSEREAVDEVLAA